MSTLALNHAVPAARMAKLRLTRPGRAVVTTLLAIPLVTGIAFASLNGGGAIASKDASTAEFAMVTIQSGESLWDVAERVAPHADPRDAVHRIMALNQLETAVLQPGQRLAVPSF